MPNPVSRNGDAFGHNERSEVTSATVADTPALYGYDGIGNSTNRPANSLNQYTSFGYDADGNMTQCGDWSYTYDSFGNTISQTGSLADAFSHRFSTKYYDAVVGLYYYGYRFYYAAAMHWFNRDPKEEDAGINLY